MILSLKLYVAAMAALSIAFWQDLDYPYWTMMTVYILALDSSGAMRQKWSYMLTGSVVGAAFGVLASFLFATSQIAILISLIVMMGMAAFFASRDRLPSFYGFMIGGVTCLLVALPGITTPDGALLRAIHRIQDIVIGASILFVVDSLVLPTTGTAGLRQVLGNWLGQLRTLCVAALRGEPLDPSLLASWLGGAGRIDPLASYLSFETVSHGAQRRRSADTIRTLGLRVLPLLDILRRLDDHRKATDLPDPDRSLRGAMAAWIETGAQEDGQRALHGALRAHVTSADADEAAPVESAQSSGWQRLLWLSQRRCLRALFASWCLIGSAQRNMEARRPVRTQRPAGSRPTPSAIAQVDVGYTLRIVLALVVHLSFFCLMWSTFKWISAYAALGGLLSSVFLVAACRSNTPVPVILKIARIVGVALGVVGIYVTLIFPHASSMGTVALVLFPVLFVLGTVVPDPGNVLFAVLPMALLRLGNNGPSVDFPTLLNSVAALALGLCSALLSIILIVRLPPGGILRRLQRESRHDLYDVLRGVETDGKAYGWRALDRFILIFQQAAQKDEKQRHVIVQRALREWRIGVDIAEMQFRPPGSPSLLPGALREQMLARFRRAIKIDAFQHAPSSPDIVPNDESGPEKAAEHIERGIEPRVEPGIRPDIEFDAQRGPPADITPVDPLLQAIDDTLSSSAIMHWPLRTRCALADVRMALFPHAAPPSGNPS